MFGRYFLPMESYKGEVITLQAGPLANRVCAHFWNLQEYGFFNKSRTNECEFPFTYKVLFDDSTREPKPHVLAIDIREVVDFGSELDPDLNPTPLDIPSWNSQVDKVVRCPSTSTKNNYHCNWTNCLSPLARRIWSRNDTVLKLPLSLQPTPDESSVNGNHQSDSVLSLSTFTEGQNVFRSGGKVADEFDDRIRRISERCSFPNSFQLVVDAEDGFTGIGSQLLENISEEFPKAFFFSVPVYNSSVVSRMDARLKKLTVVNQLCLLNILEYGDLLSHACWLPIDASQLYDHPHPCKKMSVLASVIDTVTTPSKLAIEYGGMSLDNFLSVTCFAQGRKMLTVQTGVNCNGMVDNHLSWYNLNPYYNQGKIIAGKNVPSEAVLCRQLMSRGIKHSTLLNDIWNMFSRTVDSHKTVNNSPIDIDIPYLCSLESIHSVYSLPNYPLQTGIIKQTMLSSLSTYCQQYTNTLMSCVVDVPSTNSYEAKMFEKLVKSLLLHKSHPLDNYMELETWNDFLESVQTRLVDSYLNE
ncbi:unnamed protein product [Schistosoma haematobium]|nr:unnamed protein product [Schistosoma haematobium]